MAKKEPTKKTIAPVATKASEDFRFTITIRSGSIMDKERHARTLGHVLTKLCKLNFANAVVRYNGKVVPYSDMDRGIGLSGE